MNQSRHRLERQIRHPAELLAILKPLANNFDLLANLHECLRSVSLSFRVGRREGIGGFEEMLEIFVEADLE